MTYKSKRILTTTIAGVLILAAYCLCAANGRAPIIGALTDTASLAKFMLLTIGAGIVVQILVQILFHVAVSVGIAIRDGQHDDAQIEREIEISAIEDEMDNQIGYRASRVSSVGAGIGFVAALIALASGVGAMQALNIIFISLALGSVAEGIVQVHGYERGA